jgi:O-antigen ligase
MLGGIIVTFLIFLLEYTTNGIMSTFFRKLFSGKTEFFMYYMDRGCSLVTILCLPLLISLKTKIAAPIYLAIGLMLYLSDNLAGFVAFFCGVFLMIVLKILKRDAKYLLRGGIIITALAMPVMSYVQNPYEISDRYLSSLPSAQHRLFIWNFVSQKIPDRFLEGYGFDSSRYIGDNETVQFKQYEFSLLPLHPHNNILQVFLETGLIGLILFINLLLKTICQIFRQTSDQSVYAALWSMTTYLIIGMISFGMWQMWWIASCALSYVINVVNTSCDQEKREKVCDTSSQ